MEAWRRTTAHAAREPETRRTPSDTGEDGDCGQPHSTTIVHTIMGHTVHRIYRTEILVGAEFPLEVLFNSIYRSIYSQVHTAGNDDNPLARESLLTKSLVTFLS
jgi:hypothetical protein